MAKSRTYVKEGNNGYMLKFESEWGKWKLQLLSVMIKQERPGVSELTAKRWRRFY